MAIVQERIIIRDIVHGFCHETKAETISYFLRSELTIMTDGKVTPGAVQLNSTSHCAHKVCIKAFNKEVEEVHKVFATCGHVQKKVIKKYKIFYNWDRSSPLATVRRKPDKKTGCPSCENRVALDCLVDPPKVGEQSFDPFSKENEDIIQDMRKIGLKLSQELNKLEGFQCPIIEGGIVVLTKISLPSKAIQIAEAIGRKPDEYYALELLESAGVAVALGSDFGIPPHKTYLRISIPSNMEHLEELLKSLKKFHEEFMNMHS